MGSLDIIVQNPFGDAATLAIALAVIAGLISCFVAFRARTTNLGGTSLRSNRSASTASYYFLSPVVATRVLITVLGILAFFSFVGMSLRAEPAAAAKRIVATECTGKKVGATQNLSAVADSYPAGTTFCLSQGKYNVTTPVKVQSGDSFVGVYSQFPRPTVTTTKARQVFEASGSNGATIKGIRVEGAVGYESCQPFCGRGISGGNNLRLDDVRATNNDNQGVGGSGDGLLVTNSHIDNNGSALFAEQDGHESAAGIKSVNSMKVTNSYIHDNYWAGVWCDLECGAFEVRHSTILDNGKAGIHDEVSSGPAIFSGNRIQGNGYLNSWSREAGLLIVSSRNVEAYNNTFGSNAAHGVDVYEDSRSPITGNISVHDNTMNGDSISGCNLLDVSCSSN